MPVAAKKSQTYAQANNAVKSVVKEVVKANSAPVTVQATVDQLGLLNAQISLLQEEAKVLKDFLKDKGDGAHVGKFYVATVVTAEQDRINSDAVRELLTKKQLASVTKTIEVTTVTVRGLSAAPK